MAKIDGYKHEDLLIGANIRSIRLLRKKSREDVASDLNCTQQQLKKYEDGDNSVPAPVLKRLSEILECPLLQLYAAETGRNLTTTPHESELLHMFKDLPDAEAKVMVKNIVKTLAKHFRRVNPRGSK